MSILTPITDRLNREIYEMNLRRSIYKLILQSKFKHDKYYYKHRPYSINIFYTYILPVYYFNSTVVLLYLFRNYKAFSRYSYLLLLNLYSSLFFSFGTEKLLFLEYSKTEKPYSNIMISTHIKNKDNITEESYNYYMYIDHKIREKYSHIKSEYTVL